MFNKLFKFVLKFVLVFLVITTMWTTAYRWINPPFTPLMFIRKFQNNVPNQRQYHWKDIDKISSELTLAVICSEDQQFLKHNGFDQKAITKAIDDYKNQHRLRGASTISQQTAKNLFLWPSRSWIRKGLEAYFTFLLETLLPKKRILELYLNIIEMGPDVYGAEAASKFWFGISAKDLNRDQASSLAAILPNPLIMSADPPSAYVSKRKTWIQKQMHNFKELTFNE